ncbi:NACHT domain-containing protein [Dactylonectria macrodidyma]|uniref:NACHT domain-containing protein n=1 Tax=Dactylonectria macrodidyma TaxID=307937 RepID=A0A9P9D4Q8_9HYPO|nr:NACHT domain-containing protein [Dactylonectria macrodidyma]
MFIIRRRQDQIRLLQEKHQEDDKQCLKDLHLTNPRDDKQRIQDIKGGLLKDSYRWVLDHADFRQWRDDPQSRLLWIKGDPGKGKTMLLCGIIDELEKESANRLSYFFCQATDARRNSATAVLRGLIYNLAHQYPPLIWYVRDKYDDAGKELFNDGNAWLALSGILTTILNESSLEDDIIIIDALDECDIDRLQLLDFIAKSSSSRVKWIVSSRNWPDAEERKLDKTIQYTRIILESNEDSVSSAVHTYIRYKVDQLALDKKYDDETRDAVQHHLISNANGTFLWVALACQELADSKVQKQHTLAKLKSFPPGLDSLYKKMMECICGSDNAALCKQILAIASVVYRPIDLKELRVLIESPEDFDDDDLEEIIESCSPFLTLRHGVIYFVHQSAKDFLLNKALDQILPFGIAHQHRAVFSRSLEALSGTLRRDIYSLRIPGFPIDQVSPPNPDPLASTRYSCVYWVDHLGDSDPVERMRDLQDGSVVHAFLKRKYLYWLEAVGLMRSMQEGVLAMRKLEALVVSSRDFIHILQRRPDIFIEKYEIPTTDRTTSRRAPVYSFSPAGDRDCSVAGLRISTCV